MRMERVVVVTAAQVFMFTHRMEDVDSSFVEIRSEAGHVLRITGDHYMYLNDKLATAKTARPGHILRIDNGSDVRPNACHDGCTRLTACGRVMAWGSSVIACRWWLPRWGWCGTAGCMRP